ncbi:SAM-dependent methyltransferase [Clostridium zeae]|uniref:SAM-dependent methyltransferase n=1 Tax=Clostridium zeae TaxID=2759022 RepID=A0ABQ1E5Q1_9CLOT|nr:rRNA adenine N-6-methyltransferase family protein [Clostridium zeae]GFZ30063.1 SAM-dependent methyltransferase [Clostridium zeae]
MKIIKFLLQYIRSPRTIGAVAPSSERLAIKMVDDIDFENSECIVEYGPGTGVFTDKLVERKKNDTLLILLECNEVFCKQLEHRYNEKDNVIIINDSAENVDMYLEKYKIKNVDYVVSGLPFASLPKNTSNKILKKTRAILKTKGSFITFQYTLLKKEFITNYFENIELERVILNVPPAYVLKCKNNRRDLIYVKENSNS